ncbi:MAG: hypothetical protein DMF90_13810 [Acidobacteria bacterium]|nr:MAG: hypothetical protein DMF90_13810 [Acidobacteriota bacterium]
MDRPWRTAAGHRRAAQRRLRPLLAFDCQGSAVGLRLPHPRAPARPGHRLRHAARRTDTHVSGRCSRRVAQREWRQLVESAGTWAAEEGNLLHGAARRDGH